MAKWTEDERLFRKIEDKIKRAIFDYGLINDGDRILVGLSGGKDSLALVDLLGRRSKIYCPRFEVVVAHIVMTNIPYCSDREYLRSCAEEHDLPFIVHETSFDPSTDTRKSPCFLCSWTRRKALFEIAKAHKCNKIALGHHQDDILETLLMNLTHQGAFGTMPPRLRMESHPVWVRGLKLSTAFANDQECLVAPRVGAWIETVNRSPYCHFFLCRTPCGCVD